MQPPRLPDRDLAAASPPAGEAPAVTTLRTGAQAIAAMLRLAGSLAESGREIDLAGLDMQVGRLCAGAIDLPPEQGRALRNDLCAVLAAHEALAAILGARAGPPPR